MKIYLLDLCKFKMKPMDIVWYILILGFHVYVIADAIKNINCRHGAFRLILAFIPPTIGPIIYLLTRTRNNGSHKNKEFMQGKRRFS